MELLPILMLAVLFVVILAGFPVAFSMIGVAFFFGYIEFGDSVFFQFVSKIDAAASDFVLAAVPLFIFMGTLLEKSGIAERLFSAIHLWTAKIPGGLALSSIGMCVIFAASAGVVGATEVVVGLLAMPVMLRAGYRKSLIAGTICAGGSLGTIIPPSITVVILGPTADVSVADLFVSIVFPGLILALLFAGYVVLFSFFDRKPVEISHDAGSSFVARIKETTIALVPPGLLIFLVLGSIAFGWAAPTEAAALGAAGALLLVIFCGKFSLSVLNQSLLKTLKVTSMIMFVILGGNMFTGVFMGTGGVDIVEQLIESLGLSPNGALWMFLGISFLAGLFLDWISVVLLFIPIFMPFVHTLGIHPIWFCTLFLLVIQTSYLTPPMAPAIFYLRGISPPEMKLSHMFVGVLPFIGLQVLTIFLVFFIPELAIWLPEQLLGF